MKATGITSIRKSIGLLTSDLCTSAARELMANLGVDKEVIDALIFVSQTPNDFMPSTSSQIQHNLSLNERIFAIDVNLGCSGYPYGLSVANSLIESGVASNVLVLAGDVLTPFVNPKAPSTRMVFGDAGTATWLTKSKENTIAKFGTDGSGSPYLHRRLNHSESSPSYVEMDGMEVLRFAMKKVPELVQEIVARSNAELNRDVSQVFLHQANRLIVEKIAKACSLSESVDFPLAVEGFGNTGPASIPLAICEYGKTNKLGQAALVGFGVGWSWAGIVADLSETVALPVIEIP